MAGNLISVDEARARVLATVRTLAAEDVPIGDALGRVLARDVRSELTLPPFDSSAMDGFALVAGPAAELPLVGESRAGRPYEGTLEPGQAIRISTGAMLPAGADAVIQVERAEDLGERVRAPATRPGQNVRRAGEDVQQGATVLRAGAAIGPSEIGMLAGLGRVDAPVFQQPRIAIAATGDELRPAGEQLGPGQIYDSNASAIAALARQAGAVVAETEWVEDTEDETVAALERLAGGEADVLCVTGGVSVGPHDHVKPALQRIGFEELIWGVRLKPGKPFWFGTRDSAAGAREYAFGLPGNPVSAMVTFQLFARPLLRAAQGADPSSARSTAILDGPVGANADRDQAVRCSLRLAEDGWHAEPTGPQGSHVMSSMLGAGALAIVPAGGRDLAPGERVVIELL